MRYSYEEIKEKNYVKIGSFEEFFDNAGITGKELSEDRERFKKLLSHG